MTIPERMDELEKKMSKLWDANEALTKRMDAIEQDDGAEAFDRTEEAMGSDSIFHMESPSIFGTPQHLIPEGAEEFISDGFRALRFDDSDGDTQEVKILSAYTWAHVGHGVTVTVDMMRPDDTESPAYPWIDHWLSHFSEPMSGACDHRWVSGDNEVVSNSAVCLKCATIVAADTVELSEPMPGAVEGEAKDGPTLPVSHRVTTEDGIQRELDWRDGKRMFRNLYRGEMDAQWECWKLGMDGCEVGDAWFEANKPDPAPEEVPSTAPLTDEVDALEMFRRHRFRMLDGDGSSQGELDDIEEAIKRLASSTGSSPPLVPEETVHRVVPSGGEIGASSEDDGAMGDYVDKCLSAATSALSEDSPAPAEGDDAPLGPDDLLLSRLDLDQGVATRLVSSRLEELAEAWAAERARRDAETERLRAARNSLNDQLSNKEAKIGQLVTRIADLEAQLSDHKQGQIALDLLYTELGILAEEPTGDEEMVRGIVSRYRDLEARLKAKTEELEEHQEQHAWDYSPAMAQAAIDQNAAIAERAENRVTELEGQLATKTEELDDHVEKIEQLENERDGLNREIEAQLKAAKERAPDADPEIIDLGRGGPWLGAARKWAQRNIPRGDVIEWASRENVQVPFADLWEMAEEVAEAAVREERKARARETLDIKDRWALEQKVERLEAQLREREESVAVTEATATIAKLRGLIDRMRKEMCDSSGKWLVPKDDLDAAIREKDALWAKLEDIQERESHNMSVLALVGIKPKPDGEICECCFGNGYACEGCGHQGEPLPRGFVGVFGTIWDGESEWVDASKLFEERDTAVRERDEARAKLADVKETAETIRGFWNEEKAQAATARERFAGLRSAIESTRPRVDTFGPPRGVISSPSTYRVIHESDFLELKQRLLDAHPPLPEPGEGERVEQFVRKSWTRLALSQCEQLQLDLIRHGREHYLEDILLRNGIAPLTIPEPVEPETTESES